MDARWVLAFVLLAPAFTGCIEALEASETGEAPEPDHHMEVEVVGLEDEGLEPVEGATVTLHPLHNESVPGLGNDTVNRTTGPDGATSFEVPKPAGFRLAVDAEGYVETHSTLVRVGDTQNAAEEIVGAFGCAVSLGLGCEPTITTLEGNISKLRLAVVPPQTTVEETLEVGPVTEGDTDPVLGGWHPRSLATAEDETLRAVRMFHLDAVNLTLSWENTRTERAEAELTFGCGESDEHASTEQGETETLLDEAEHERSLAVEPPRVDEFTLDESRRGNVTDGERCLHPFAGPQVYAGSTGNTFELDATLTFGPRPQVPLVAVGNSTAESW